MSENKTLRDKIGDNVKAFFTGVAQICVISGGAIGVSCLVITVCWLFLSAMYCVSTQGWGITTITECMIFHDYVESEYWLHDGERNPAYE